MLGWTVVGTDRLPQTRSWCFVCSGLSQSEPRPPSRRTSPLRGRAQTPPAAWDEPLCSETPWSGRRRPEGGGRTRRPPCCWLSAGRADPSAGPRAKSPWQVRRGESRVIERRLSWNDNSELLFAVQSQRSSRRRRRSRKGRTRRRRAPCSAPRPSSTCCSGGDARGTLPEDAPSPRPQTRDAKVQASYILNIYIYI